MPSMPSLRYGANRYGTPKHTPHISVPVARAVVDCAVYVNGQRTPGHQRYDEALKQVRDTGEGFVWVGLLSPDDEQMNRVGEVFGLHELVIEDAVQAHQRPKLEQYDNILFLVLKTINFVPHESIDKAREIVESGEIMIIVGPDFVITVRHGDHSGLKGVRGDMEHRPDRLAMGPMAVMHAIADHVVDNYLLVLDAVEEDVDASEVYVFTPGSKIAIEPIYLLKREILEFRRAVTPLNLPLEKLTEPSSSLVPKEVRRLFRDVRDHHTQVTERVASFDDLLSSLIDAALAKIGIQQNTDMRKISAWVAVAAVPTMIAGIYGMNFDNMPELHWKYGYFIVLSVLFLVVVGLIRTFRRNNWL